MEFHCFRCFYDADLLGQLFRACCTHLRFDQWELPVGLISRLILADMAFVQQFAAAADEKQVADT